MAILYGPDTTSFHRFQLYRQLHLGHPYGRGSRRIGQSASSQTAPGFALRDASIVIKSPLIIVCAGTIPTQQQTQRQQKSSTQLVD